MCHKKVKTSIVKNTKFKLMDQGAESFNMSLGEGEG